MPEQQHLPVMVAEVLAALEPRAGGSYIDLTVGLGGHARAILEASAPDGQLLCIDRDPAALERARAALAGYADRVRFARGPFSGLEGHLRAAGIGAVDGLLADLGVSSLQLDDPARGFSFSRPGPLDMRMGPDGPGLAELLRSLSPERLAAALRQLGEVPEAGKVARRILQAFERGGLRTTADLAEAIGQGGRPKPGRNPATQAFMALRMLVNAELDELEALLGGLPWPLKVGGRAVFLSFHSLEDRMVKRRLNELEGRCICPPGLPACRCERRPLMRLLRRRATRPTGEEVAENPRSRSAKLRAAERVAA